VTRNDSRISVVAVQHVGDLRVRRRPSNVVARRVAWDASWNSHWDISAPPLVVFCRLHERSVHSDCVEAVHDLLRGVERIAHPAVLLTRGAVRRLVPARERQH
jgi:hypothetical protein